MTMSSQSHAEPHSQLATSARLLTSGAPSAIAVIEIHGTDVVPILLQCWKPLTKRPISINSIRYGRWIGPQSMVSNDHAMEVQAELWRTRRRSTFPQRMSLFALPVLIKPRFTAMAESLRLRESSVTWHFVELLLLTKRCSNHRSFGRTMWMLKLPNKRDGWKQLSDCSSSPVLAELHRFIWTRPGGRFAEALIRLGLSFETAGPKMRSQSSIS